MINKSPLSPHLTIYKPQITSILSIMHRITGLVMFFTLLSTLWFINLHTFRSSTLESFFDILVYISVNKFFMSMFIAFSYCMFFHLCAGIRYFIWDLGKLMNLKMINITGWIVIISSIVFTIVFWYIIS